MGTDKGVLSQAWVRPKYTATFIRIDDDIFADVVCRRMRHGIQDTARIYFRWQGLLTRSPHESKDVRRKRDRKSLC